MINVKKYSIFMETNHLNLYKMPIGLDTFLFS